MLLLPRNHAPDLSWMFLWVWLFLAGGSAWADAVPAPAAADPVLAERVAARWRALVEGDLAAAYAFETPAYRAATPLKLYSSRFGQQLRWTEARVLSTEIREDTARARVRVSYATLDPSGSVMTSARPLDETWIRLDGQWWHGAPQ